MHRPGRRTMTVLHLMVGLPGSGKTTWAREIENETSAIRLTPDEWQTRLRGDDTYHPDHERLHDSVEAIMRELAEALLRRGVDVILDFGFWSRRERNDLHAFARQLGVGCMTHYAAATPAVLERRRQERITEAPPDKFTFTAASLAEWIALFEPPDTAELEQGEIRTAQ